jgi:hypothetical protein
LQEYGDSLIGTAAFPRLIAIVDEKKDFALLDAKLDAHGGGTGNLPADFTDQERLQIQECEVKVRALTAVVMSGVPEGLERLQRLTRSCSATERLIASQVSETKNHDGSWKRGKVPTKEQVPQIPFGFRRTLKPDEVVPVIRKALASGDRKEVLKAFRTLREIGLTILQGGQEKVQLIVEALSKTDDLAKKDPEVREARRGYASYMLVASDTLEAEGRIQIVPFAERAAADADQRIAELGAAVLHFLSTSAK